MRSTRMRLDKMARIGLDRWKLHCDQQAAMLAFWYAEDVPNRFRFGAEKAWVRNEYGSPSDSRDDDSRATGLRRRGVLLVSLESWGWTACVGVWVAIGTQEF